MIVVSVSFYALSKELGAKAARLRVQGMLADPEAADTLPAIRTIMRVRELDDTSLFPDFGGANCAKMRTRAAHAFLETGAHTWVSCDDDVECTGETLRDLVEAVAGDEPAVCIAPCLLRSSDVVNVIVPPNVPIAPRELPSGGLAIPCLAGGWGLVAANRALLVAMAEAHPDLVYLDDDGEARCALFHETIEARHWWGEDLSFFRRVPAGARIECLIKGCTSHDGQALMLHTVSDRPRIDATAWGPSPAPPAVREVPTVPPETDREPDSEERMRALEPGPDVDETSPETPSAKHASHE